MSDKSPHIVWVAEVGCYEDRVIEGIYDSAERAMAALGGTKWRHTLWTHYDKWPDRSHVTRWESWDNDGDWGGAASILPMVIVEDGPMRRVDETVIQTLRESDAGWDYVPITETEAAVIIGRVAEARP